MSLMRCYFTHESHRRTVRFEKKDVLQKKQIILKPISEQAIRSGAVRNFVREGSVTDVVRVQL